MDLREKKTKRSITNAFLTLRSKKALLPMQIEKELRHFIHKHYPDMSTQNDMRLTYNIYGSYYVYQKYYKTTDMNHIIDIVSQAHL